MIVSDAAAVIVDAIFLSRSRAKSIDCVYNRELRRHFAAETWLETVHYDYSRKAMRYTIVLLRN
jgi:hypothetical protein